MLRMHKWLVAMLLAGALAACAAAPASFDARLATAYQTVTAIRTSTAQLVTAGKVTSTKGQAVLNVTDRAREALDAAAANKDEGSLDLALSVLKTVEEHVQ